MSTTGSAVVDMRAMSGLRCVHSWLKDIADPQERFRWPSGQLAPACGCRAWPQPFQPQQYQKSKWRSPCPIVLSDPPDRGCRLVHTPFPKRGTLAFMNNESRFIKNLDGFLVQWIGGTAANITEKVVVFGFVGGFTLLVWFWGFAGPKLALKLGLFALGFSALAMILGVLAYLLVRRSRKPKAEPAPAQTSTADRLPPLKKVSNFLPEEAHGLFKLLVESKSGELLVYPNSGSNSSQVRNMMSLDGQPIFTDEQPAKARKTETALTILKDSGALDWSGDKNGMVYRLSVQGREIEDVYRLESVTTPVKVPKTVEVQVLPTESALPKLGGDALDLLAWLCHDQHRILTVIHPFHGQKYIRVGGASLVEEDPTFARRMLDALTELEEKNCVKKTVSFRPEFPTYEPTHTGNEVCRTEKLPKPEPRPDVPQHVQWGLSLAALELFQAIINSKTKRLLLNPSDKQQVTGGPVPFIVYIGGMHHVNWNEPAKWERFAPAFEELKTRFLRYNQKEGDWTTDTNDGRELENAIRRRTANPALASMVEPPVQPATPPSLESRLSVTAGAATLYAQIVLSPTKDVRFSRKTISNRRNETRPTFRLIHVGGQQLFDNDDIEKWEQVESELAELIQHGLLVHESSDRLVLKPNSQGSQDLVPLPPTIATRTDSGITVRISTIFTRVSDSYADAKLTIQVFNDSEKDIGLKFFGIQIHRLGQMPITKWSAWKKNEVIRPNFSAEQSWSVLEAVRAIDPKDDRIEQADSFYAVFAHSNIAAPIPSSHVDRFLRLCIEVHQRRKADPVGFETYYKEQQAKRHVKV